MSVVALGDDFGPFFATPAMQKPATRIYIPHMVSGTGYVTKLTLVNPSASASDVTLSEYGQTGQVLKQTQFTLAAHGAKRMATPEEDRFRSTPTTTWAIVDATQPIAANLFFEVIFDPASRAVVNTVGFNDAPLMAEFSFPAEFEPAQPGASVGRTVGLAVANPWASSTSVTIHLINPEGIVVATEARSLPAFGQFTLDLSSDPVFTAVLPAGSFVGTVTVVASNPVAAIALEDDRGPFSALPMMSGRTF